MTSSRTHFNPDLYPRMLRKARIYELLGLLETIILFSIFFYVLRNSFSLKLLFWLLGVYFFLKAVGWLFLKALLAALKKGYKFTIYRFEDAASTRNP